MTAWERDLAAALQAHALIEAGDQARGITSSAALRAMWAVRHAIAQTEAAGATEEQLDQVITRAGAPTSSPSNDESRPPDGERLSTTSDRALKEAPEA
jgi:hypothetical protein